MTDGPATQSVLPENVGTMGVYIGTTGGSQPNQLIYTALNNGSILETASVPLTASLSSSQQIYQFSIGPTDVDFPLSPQYSEYDFKVQAAIDDVNVGQALYFQNVCKQKYPNIRIKWKNRYGQFDWFNFYMVNRQGFQATKRTYQPQLGTWNGSSLSYQDYDSSTLNYISDSSQTLSVNTNYVSEDYNDIFKQLLVSDEIYWVYVEGLPGSPWSFGFDDNGYGGGTATTKLRPITIKTDSIVFKTGVVDKTIQYGFDFDWGQSYKLII
jgi:hypothetical protein